MDDPDATLPVPKPVPSGGGSGRPTDEEVKAALQLGMETARPPSASASYQWQPPTVEELQSALPQFEVTDFIARGGMGAVYKGRHRALDRAVAIKILPPVLADGDGQFAARFRQEARAMARLSHPNIVSVFDAGETAQGLLYFVMEFIEGTDVAQLIRKEGKLEPERAIPIIRAVCEALAFAHDEGIIHRDIKPSNVMLDHRGRVKVADFGLAKTVNLESSLMTRSDMAMGTPDFIAPEALIAGVQVDKRADIYAVGVMLYQMLTGSIPRGRFLLPSALVPQIDPGFDGIVDKAMQVDRDRRYSSAIEISTELLSVAENQAAFSAQASNKTARPKKPSLSLWSSVLASLVLAGAVILLAPWERKESPTAKPASTQEKTAAVPGPFNINPQPTRSASIAGGEVAKQAEAIWKERWSKPGKLQGLGTTMSGSPVSLKQAESYSDFVQVVALNPGVPVDGKLESWVALRSNGQLVWSSGKPDASDGKLALVRCEQEVKSILVGGRVQTAEVPSPEGPVMDLAFARMQFIRGDQPLVLAWRDLNGEWFIESSAYDSKQMVKPELSGDPKTKKVTVGFAGVGVLREDGSVRIWNKQEIQLPDELRIGIKTVLSQGNAWTVLKTDGRVLTFTMAESTPSSGVKLFYDSVKKVAPISYGEATEIQSAGYAHLERNTEGLWSTRVEGEVENKLRELGEDGNNSFSVFQGRAGDGKLLQCILWIDSKE